MILKKTKKKNSSFASRDEKKRDWPVVLAGSAEAPSADGLPRAKINILIHPSPDPDSHGDDRRMANLGRLLATPAVYRDSSIVR